MPNPIRTGAVAALCLALLLLTACSRPPPAEEPVRAVKLMTIAAGTVATQPELAGDVRARVESRIGFRVGGKLVRRQVEVGQRVRPGQVLAQLDVQDYALATDAVRAQLQVAVTNRDLAEADLKRYRELREQNFISSAELDRRESTWKAANAQVEQARAQLATQGNQSAYATLRSDVAGVVVGVEAEPGQVVGAGTPIVRIALDGPWDVVFAIAEDRLADIAIGTAVELRRWASNLRLSGQVREIGAVADPVTRTYQVKASIPSATAPALGSTMAVVPVALSAKGAPAIKVPTSALKQQGQGSAVWVFDAASSSVRTQPVQVLAADGNEVVVASGLTPGMQVVIAGVHVLAEGQKVSVFKPRSTP